jgi:hypothetical protein
MNGINPLAVIVAAVSSFLLGGLWYSPAFFGRAWNKEEGRGPDFKQPHPAKVFGVSLVLALVAAAAFAAWVGPRPDLKTALTQGLVAGAGFVAASLGINYQFADRGVRLWLIDGGYHTAQFVLFGLVLGLWH